MSYEKKNEKRNIYITFISYYSRFVLLNLLCFICSFFFLSRDAFVQSAGGSVHLGFEREAVIGYQY